MIDRTEKFYWITYIDFESKEYEQAFIQGCPMEWCDGGQILINHIEITELQYRDHRDREQDRIKKKVAHDKWLEQCERYDAEARRHIMGYDIDY